VKGEVFVVDQGAYGRVLIADSLTYCDDRANARDVFVGASFAGASPVAVALRAGVKAVIAHACGVGKDDAGIAGLELAQRFGVPAAAVETMSARVSDARSLYDGIIGHANAAALRYGVKPGMATHTAAWALLAAPPGRPAEITGLPGDEVRELYRGGQGGIYGAWSLSLVEGKRPGDVFCAGSHSGAVMCRYALQAGPKAVIANDGGRAKDDSAIAGLPMLDRVAMPAAAVAAASARIGDPRSTYEEGVLSAVNAAAAAAGLRVGMSARAAAHLLLALPGR